ncbi:hypothetical protein LEP1GSC186_4672 [Leptospira noguchii serovar Autumnalis str. ZUN142]|uniref:Uncharacterized protein n=1 Tax=Leptospira noguchii serovar Autumnalis str. ZUN142 TaxID=1085540 RepID=M6UUW2_9LEPT|nr:hypothetical protein LEP1GSC186_4672 [Leptospira noguchii serovar Autumnalis str. ZUN142]
MNAVFSYTELTLIKTFNFHFVMPAKQQFHTEIESDDSLEIYHSNYIMVGLFRNLECRLPSKKPIMKKFYI